jgi:hypothetical protein
MLKALVCSLLLFLVGTAWYIADCQGCGREAATWGGGAFGEVWSYVPGPNDHDGECDPSNCNWTKHCYYGGTLKFTNGGGGARDVVDADGNIVANVPQGGVWGPAQIAVKSGCGATGDAAGQYQGRNGLIITSAYMFYCGGCFESGG